MAFAPVPVSGAIPDMCAGQLDQKDASFGYASSGPDPKFVSACDGASGPDAFNNAVTPNAMPNLDARKPLPPRTIDSGSYDEVQNVIDADGLQADEVRYSPLFTP